MAIIIRPKNVYEAPSNNKVVDNDITRINYTEHIVTASTPLSMRASALPITLYNATDTRRVNTSPITSNVAFKSRNADVTDDYSTVFEIIQNPKTYDINTSPTGLPITQYHLEIQGEIKNLLHDFDMEGNYNCTATIVGDFPYVHTPMTTLVDDEVYPNIKTLTNVQIPISIYNTYNDFYRSLGELPLSMEDKPYIKFAILKDGSTAQQGGNLKFAMRIEYDRSVSKWEEIDGVTNLVKNRMYVMSFSFDIKTQEFYYNDNSISIGSGVYDFQLNSNELFQQGSVITQGQNSQKISQYLANNIINKWTNGKETATMLVEYGEYYDENGTLQKSITDTSANPKPMQFYRGDVVIPYIGTSLIGDNEITEIPLSRKQNGQPKEFLVVGVEPIYDGACWQRLTLLEN